MAGLLNFKTIPLLIHEIFLDRIKPNQFNLNARVLITLNITFIANCFACANHNFMTPPINGRHHICIAGNYTEYSGQGIVSSQRRLRNGSEARQLQSFNCNALDKTNGLA